MVHRVLIKYSIVQVLYIITSVSIKSFVSPTLYIACPYLVSRMVWKSREDFLLALDHCGVVIFCFYTAVYSIQIHYVFRRG